MTNRKESEYKLDFKFKLNDEIRVWTTTDFKAGYYYWTDDSNTALSLAMKEIKDTFYKEKFSGDEYTYSYYNASTEKLLEMKNFIIASPEWQKCEVAFQKWLKRRSGVQESWIEFVNSWNSKKDVTKQISTGPLTLALLGDHLHRTDFRTVLENSRPIKIVAGSIVKLLDKHKNSYNYDPYYWDAEHMGKERVGTVLQYTGDCGTRKCGTGSREIRVLWFGSGKETKITEKSLELYVPPVEKDESVSQ